MVGMSGDNDEICRYALRVAVYNYSDSINSNIGRSICSSPIGAVEWLTMARIVRGQTKALREQTFIDAAIAGRCQYVMLSDSIFYPIFWYNNRIYNADYSGGNLSESVISFC